MPLGEVLHRAGTSESVDASRLYPTLGVKSHARGAFDSGVLQGASTAYRTLTKVQAGWLVYPKLMAWEGALAMVPTELGHRWVTPEFVAYDVIGEELSREYLGHLIAWGGFLDWVRAGSAGTNVRRRRLQPAALEAIQIPLPSRPEQDRIAAHCDRLAATLGSARALGMTEVPSTESAWLQTAFDRDWSLVPMGDAFTLSRGSVLKQDPNGSSLALGQASVRWGYLDHSLGKPLDDDWAGKQDPSRRVAEGDLLLNSTGEGTIGRAAVVRAEDAGMLHDSKVMRLRPSGAVHPEFAALFLRSPRGQDAVSLIKGANTTKQTELGIKRTAGLLVPAPFFEVQQRVVHSWRALGPLFARAAQLQNQRNLLAASILPSARNKIFSAMR